LLRSLSNNLAAVLLVKLVVNVCLNLAVVKLAVNVLISLAAVLLVKLVVNVLMSLAVVLLKVVRPKLVPLVREAVSAAIARRMSDADLEHLASLVWIVKTFTTTLSKRRCVLTLFSR
jgi:hypothetical protein